MYDLLSNSCTDATWGATSQSGREKMEVHGGIVARQSHGSVSMRRGCLEVADVAVTTTMARDVLELGRNRRAKC